MVAILGENILFGVEEQPLGVGAEGFAEVVIGHEAWARATHGFPRDFVAGAGAGEIHMNGAATILRGEALERRGREVDAIGDAQLPGERAQSDEIGFVVRARGGTEISSAEPAAMAQRRAAAWSFFTGESRPTQRMSASSAMTARPVKSVVSMPWPMTASLSLRYG